MKQLLTLFLIILTVGVMGQNTLTGEIRTESLNTVNNEWHTVNFTSQYYDTVTIWNENDYYFNPVEDIFKEYEAECDKDSTKYYQVGYIGRAEVVKNTTNFEINYGWTKDTASTGWLIFITTSRIKYIHETVPSYEGFKEFVNNKFKVK